MKDSVENDEIVLDTSGTECPIPVLKARKLAQEAAFQERVIDDNQENLDLLEDLQRDLGVVQENTKVEM